MTADKESPQQPIAEISNPSVNKVVMTELANFSQTNWKSLSKAKSADKPFVMTKPCGHEGTLDGGNPKTSDVRNDKPWTIETTSDAQECQTLGGRNDLRRLKCQTSEAR